MDNEIRYSLLKFLLLRNIVIHAVGFRVTSLKKNLQDLCLIATKLRKSNAELELLSRKGCSIEPLCK